MSEYSFDPLVFSWTEYTGSNLANEIVNNVEWGVHYLLPKAYLGYQGVKWAFSNSNTQVNANANNAQPEPGFFSRCLNISSRGLKLASKLSIPLVSDYAYNRFLKESFWDRIRPIAVAAMRPPLQKLVPYIYNPAQKSNGAFNLRYWFVPEGDDSRWTIVGKPFWHARKFLFPGNAEHKVAETAYVLSEKMTDAALLTAKTAYDTLLSATQIGKSIFEHKFKKSMSDGWDYTQLLRANALDYGKETMRFVLCKSGEFGDNLMYTAESLSDFIDYKAGWKIPVNHIYYMETAAVVVLGSMAVCAATKSAYSLLNNQLFKNDSAVGSSTFKPLFNLRKDNSRTDADAVPPPAGRLAAQSPRL